jgi:phosphatidate cytidylyltransferase
MKNLAVRTLSGAIYVGLITLSILCGPYTYAALFAVIAGLALWEFYRLLEKNAQVRINKTIAIIGGLYLFVSGFLGFAGILSLRYISLWFVFMLYLLIREVYAGRKNPIREVAYTFLGQIYIVLPLMFLGWLAYVGDTEETNTFSPVFLMAFFALIWMYDTGAYIVGVTLGKHRLMERVSPKKSWEGLIGGLILALAASVVISILFPGYLTMVQWIGFALITVVFGTWGDLVESMIKRSLNVKDSGNMIPGHGGILDRIDSCLLAAPAVLIYFLFIL